MAGFSFLQGGKAKAGPGFQASYVPSKKVVQKSPYQIPPGAPVGPTPTSQTTPPPPAYQPGGVKVPSGVKVPGGVKVPNQPGGFGTPIGPDIQHPLGIAAQNLAGAKPPIMKQEEIMSTAAKNYLPFMQSQKTDPLAYLKGNAYLTNKAAMQQTQPTMGKAFSKVSSGLENGTGTGQGGSTQDWASALFDQPGAFDFGVGTGGNPTNNNVGNETGGKPTKTDGLESGTDTGYKNVGNDTAWRAPTDEGWDLGDAGKNRPFFYPGQPYQPNPNIIPNWEANPGETNQFTGGLNPDIEGMYSDAEKEAIKNEVMGGLNKTSDAEWKAMKDAEMLAIQKEGQKTLGDLTGQAGAMGTLGFGDTMAGMAETRGATQAAMGEASANLAKAKMEQEMERLKATMNYATQIGDTDLKAQTAQQMAEIESAQAKSTEYGTTMKQKDEVIETAQVYIDNLSDLITNQQVTWEEAENIRNVLNNIIAKAGAGASPAQLQAEMYKYLSGLGIWVE